MLVNVLYLVILMLFALWWVYSTYSSSRYWPIFNVILICVSAFLLKYSICMDIILCHCLSYVGMLISRILVGECSGNG